MSTTGAAPQRRMDLQGASNFRDLGGYEAADGRTVKWRQLYRSNSLAALTDADLEHVAGLEIKLICDLRREEESVEAPTRLPATNAPVILQLPIGPERKDSKLYEYLWSGEATEAQMRQVMQDIYAEFAIRFAPQYAEFMRRVSRADQLPLLFHCAAGKDRTGVAAALLLGVLGVDDDTIIADYALSQDNMARALAKIQARPDAERILAGRPLAAFEAPTDAVIGFVEAVHATHGGWHAAAAAIGIDDATVRRLRELLLTD